ncbi:hypothetical protein ATC03_10620 [Agromyces aureus]|uniref:Uncharacterized protein n=1 Tax=Agromyces aureus TaxID=453304 RepID=A0A191WG06_9MICO|nr:hypothetical protein ATC03_10620 [Agromyces aureus]
MSKAVLRYARALADAHTSDVVTIPILGEGGAVTTAHVLLGPASQLFSTHVADSIGEFTDAALVADLEERTRRIEPSTVAWPDEMTDIGLDAEELQEPYAG